MVFGFVECAAIAAYVAFVFLPLFPRRDHKHKKSENEEPEKEKHTDMSYMGWRMYRYIMGALLVVTLFYFTQNALPDSWQLIMGFILMVALVILKKSYCSVRHKYNSPGVHALMLLLILGCIAGIYVAMCVEPNGGLWPVNVACFSVFVLLYLMKRFKRLLGPCLVGVGVKLRFGAPHHHHHSKHNNNQNVKSEYLFVKP